MYEMLGEQFVSTYNVQQPNVELSSNDNDLDSQDISVLMEVYAAAEGMMMSIK